MISNRLNHSLNFGVTKNSVKTKENIKNMLIKFNNEFTQGAGTAQFENDNFIISKYTENNPAQNPCKF